MNFSTYVLNEDLKKLGKMKLRDTLKSFRFSQSRGMNRKNLRQVPDSHSATALSPYRKSLTQFIRGMDVSHKVVDMAKMAPSGVWRVSKQQVIDIARKYNFYIPTDEKPMKHLGSTGIQLIRYKPSVYYLYKPRRRKRRKRITKNVTMKASSIMKGI